MAREVDKRKTGKALRRLKRAAERVGASDGPGLTDWEKAFVSGVSERLETYGSAFRDPAKGPLDEALSQRQTQIVRALDKKGRPKSKSAKKSAETTPPKPASRSTFKRKAPSRTGRSRDINDDLAPDLAPDLAQDAPAPAAPVIAPKRRRRELRVVPGGRIARPQLGLLAPKG